MVQGLTGVSKQKTDGCGSSNDGGELGGAGGEGRAAGQVSYTLKDILSLNTNRNPVLGCFYFSKLLLEQLDCSLYLTVLLFHVRQKACHGIWGLVKGLEGSKAAKGGMQTLSSYVPRAPRCQLPSLHSNDRQCPAQEATVHLPA